MGKSYRYLTATLAILVLLVSGCSSKGGAKSDAAGTTPSLSGSAQAGELGGEGGSGGAGSGGATGTSEGAPTERVIYFDFDRSEIRPDARAVLEQHAAFLSNRSTNVRLEGHADERGSREYNLALGERRAESVKRTLTILGVPDSLVTTLSYGEERPMDKGHNETAWQVNRRVEIIYTQ